MEEKLADILSFGWSMGILLLTFVSLKFDFVHIVKCVLSSLEQVSRPIQSV